MNISKQRGAAKKLGFIAIFAALLFVAKPLLLLCYENGFAAYNAIFNGSAMPLLSIMQSIGRFCAYSLVAFAIVIGAWLLTKTLLAWVLGASNANKKA